MLKSNTKIAIVGATGVVGQTLLKLLSEKKFPAEKLILLASARSAGKRLLYQDQVCIVQDLAHFDFKQVALAFFAAGSEVAEHYAPIAANAGCIVIDKSAHFRLVKEIPLVVPEVNGALINSTSSKIIAVPNCSTIQLVVALKPLHDLAEVTRVDVATYQAVSGAGQAGVAELQQQMKAYQQQHALPLAEKFAAQIAFNVVPVIDVFMPSGFTKEELKMHEETRKILAADLLVNATAVRVPVWKGHSEAVHVKTKKPFTLSDAEKAYQQCPGLHYLSDEVPTAVTHAANSSNVWLGRLRRHPDDPAHYLNFWVVSDNLYKGAAFNALQIAELIR